MEMGSLERKISLKFEKLKYLKNEMKKKWKNDMILKVESLKKEIKTFNSNL